MNRLHQTGPIVKLAFDVAEQLESVESKSVAVASVHTVKPLDVERVSAILTNYETVVVIEEHSERGGLGARVKEIAWDCRASCKLHTYALRDAFIHVFGSQSELREAHGLSAERILKEVGSDPA